MLPVVICTYDWRDTKQVKGQVFQMLKKKITPAPDVTSIAGCGGKPAGTRGQPKMALCVRDGLPLPDDEVELSKPEPKFRCN